ncbi:hypothetical protein Syun_006169 [Stephania yunnanensis]|uniref:Uncharacterized protein n=1 Tax=Stephania yunnanensis TaxID=152371 RepID=A0AAP0KXJ2_9MAGN
MGNELYRGLCGKEMKDLNHILQDCLLLSLIWNDFLRRNEVEAMLELPLNQLIIENLSNNMVFKGVGWPTFFAT